MFFIGVLLLLFRERKREREKNLNVKEKYLSIASRKHPDQGLNPQPSYVP